ncbi:MAG TPA: hypothetical protein VEU52_09435 [Candidatus Limnocylindrales bacterium]|jgi:hypothetical protein|nr:hypothetical protein [Candidatus Limnocylindrales bacterium]
MLNKAMFAGIALGAFLILGGASTARADDRRSCEEKIEHEQHELDRAIARHGYYSRQANHERRELDRLVARCRYRGDRDRDDYYHYR